MTNKDGFFTMYETDSYGIEFAVNDQLSISYSKEKSEGTKDNAIADDDTSDTKTKVESDITSLQAAYVIGGATIGIAQTETSDAD